MEAATTTATEAAAAAGLTAALKAHMAAKALAAAEQEGLTLLRARNTQAKILRFRSPKVTILSRFQRSLESPPASGPEDRRF